MGGGAGGRASQVLGAAESAAGPGSYSLASFSSVSHSFESSCVRFLNRTPAKSCEPHENVGMLCLWELFLIIKWRYVFCLFVMEIGVRTVNQRHIENIAQCHVFE